VVAPLSLIKAWLLGVGWKTKRKRKSLRKFGRHWNEYLRMAKYDNKIVQSQFGHDNPSNPCIIFC
jgi:hypothetical protein